MIPAQAKAPGKLYIAGEYAVVKPGQPAVITAVDRFITVSLSPSKKHYGTLSSSQLSSDTLHWKRADQQISLDETNEKAAILLKTIEVTERYLIEQGLRLPYYDIKIKSNLDSADGRKFGLGSSGAVTIAMIDALLKSVGYTDDEDKLFKLAALTHTLLNSRGSFGDLAAAAYTGWIAYSSPDKEWVKRQLPQLSLTSLLDKDWPEMNIERLPSPKQLDLIVGWTGVPASTESYVSSVQEDQSELDHQNFLHQSKTCVSDLIIGLKTDDTSRITESIRFNRELLLRMSQTKKILLETPLLALLITVADKYGAVAKTSGAGGGDCGIAFVHSLGQKKRIESEWRTNNIEPLPLTVYDKSNS